jgi:hypothetical protein
MDVEGFENPLIIDILQVALKQSINMIFPFIIWDKMMSATFKYETPKTLIR